jgi:hypothetical protein
VAGLSAAGVAHLPPELRQVYTVLGCNSRTKKNYGNVVIVSRAKLRIFVDINFRESCA